MNINRVGVWLVGLMAATPVISKAILRVVRLTIGICYSCVVFATHGLVLWVGSCFLKSMKALKMPFLKKGGILMGENSGGLMDITAKIEELDAEIELIENRIKSLDNQIQIEMQKLGVLRDSRGKLVYPAKASDGEVSVDHV